jgi:hypothetical protein
VTSRGLVAVALAVASGSVMLGCTSVDLGTPPADVNACRPGQQFFADQIWPMVLDKDYSGVKCSDSGCHGPATTTPLRLLPVQPPAPIPLTGDWAANYIAASEEMQCTNVRGSALFVNPTGQVVHGGKKLFDANSPEATLLEMWVTQP